MLQSDNRSSADIVERLRNRDAIVMSGLFHAIPVMREAADEIERLRHDLDRHMQIVTDLLNDAQAVAATTIKPTEEMVLAGGDVLLAACESPNGNLHPWKPFDVAQIAIKVYAAMMNARTPDVAQAEPVAWHDAAALQAAHEIVALPENWPYARKKAAIQVIVAGQMARAAQPPAAPVETCSRCGGSGLSLNGQGEPDECHECKGNTVVPRSSAESKSGVYTLQPIFDAMAASTSIDVDRMGFSRIVINAERFVAVFNGHRDRKLCTAIDSRDAAQAEKVKQQLAAAMMFCGLATGHGDTIEDLIEEMRAQVTELQDRFAAQPPAAPVETDVIAVDKKLLHSLWCYGQLHTVEGVVYSYGTHQKCLEAVDDLIVDHAAACEAKPHARCSADNVTAAVRKVLATDKWPINRDYDDAGLSEANYIKFVSEVIAAMPGQPQQSVDIVERIEDELDAAGCLALTDEGLEAFREIMRRALRATQPQGAGK